MRRLMAAVLLLTFSLLAFNSCGYYVRPVDNSGRIERFNHLGKKENPLFGIIRDYTQYAEEGLARIGATVEKGHLRPSLNFRVNGRYNFRLESGIEASSERYGVMLNIKFLGEERETEGFH